MSSVNRDGASMGRGVGLFLLFSFFLNCGVLFLYGAFKFIAFDLTKSPSMVSLVGSVSASAFITFGLVSGIIVDAISRRLFIVSYLVIFAVASMVFYVLYAAGFVTITLFFLFVFLHESAGTFSFAARNSVFYDLCGTGQLSRWISYRAIVGTLSSIVALVVLAYFVGTSSRFFVVYTVFLILSYLTFRCIGYEDQNVRKRFSSPGEIAPFIIRQFREFIAVSRGNRALSFLFLFSFFKTIFVYWPMAVGALLKFGIGDDTTRRFYLYAMIFMELTTVLSTYAIGKKKYFTNGSFVVGVAITGLGIALFSLTRNPYLSAVMLSIMYVGLAISAVASSFILRMELPADHHTQGLAFSVVPYYLADVVSGILYAMLLKFCTVDQLLLGTGLALAIISVMVYPLAQKKKISS